LDGTWLDSASAGNTLPDNNKPITEQRHEIRHIYELQLPRPWQAGGELKLYQDALTQLETADRCGYDHAWVVEHHFLEEYSHSPSPESFLAARQPAHQKHPAWHGIFQLTTNHPGARSPNASRCSISSATAAANSGMGRAPRSPNLTPFGRDMETKRKCSRSGPRHLSDVQRGRQRASRQVFSIIPCACCAETGAEAASAIVDGVFAASDHRAAPARTALGHSASSSSAQNAAHAWVQRLLQCDDKG